MTFRRIYPNTIPAKTLDQAKQRALMLYKEWIREVPRSIRKYPLDFTIAKGRSRVRFEFERFRYLKDLEQINRVILLGTMELVETHNKWKQKMHVMRMYEDMNNEWFQNKEAQKELPSISLHSPTPHSPFLKGFLQSNNHQDS